MVAPAGALTSHSAGSAPADAAGDWGASGGATVCLPLPATGKLFTSGCGAITSSSGTSVSATGVGSDCSCATAGLRARRLVDTKRLVEKSAAAAADFMCELSLLLRHLRHLGMRYKGYSKERRGLFDGHCNLYGRADVRPTRSSPENHGPSA